MENPRFLRELDKVYEKCFTKGRTEGSSKFSEAEPSFLDSSMVEHSAVNRVVVGSSPTRGAKESPQTLVFAGFCIKRSGKKSERKLMPAKAGRKLLTENKQ